MRSIAKTPTGIHVWVATRGNACAGFVATRDGGDGAEYAVTRYAPILTALHVTMPEHAAIAALRTYGWRVTGPYAP